MPRSNPVIRRYTPPTCTLEVLAENSPLGQWMQKSVLKQVRFELHFDDPRLQEDERVTIRGNRDQLESLSTAVHNYVQQFLQESPDKFWQIYGNQTELEQSKSDSYPPREQTNLSTTAVLNNHNSESTSSDIYLKPSNHLAHNLFLGSLASPASGPSIKLSLLQLFDLASALDDYNNDAIALPNLNQQQTQGWKVPSWAPVAAVLAVGVGLTPLTLRYVNNARQQQTAVEPTTTAADGQIALQPTPTIPLTPQPTATLTPGFPNINALPPAPPPGSLLNIPNGATLPNVPVTPNQASPNSNIPSPAATPGATPPIANSPNQFVFPTNAPVPGGSLVIPNTVPAPPKVASGQATTPPKLPTINAPTTPPPIASIPADITLPEQLKQPTSPTASSRTSANPSTKNETADTSELIRRIREGQPSVTAENTANRSGSGRNQTLFDTPQVSEARTFLSKRWEPPSGLKQTLEYSLIVGVDGSIERILPLGRAARTYIDRTGMPLIGEPFVSPNRNGQPIRIRAVYTPDGKVKAFPEND